MKSVSPIFRNPETSSIRQKTEHQQEMAAGTGVCCNGHGMLFNHFALLFNSFIIMLLFFFFLAEMLSIKASNGISD